MKTCMTMKSEYSIEEDKDNGTCHVHVCFSTFPDVHVASLFAANLRTAVEHMCAQKYSRPDYAPSPEAIQ